MRIPFTKMVGTGNDFIIVDARRRRLMRLARQWRAVSRALCERRSGIGADGLLVLEPSTIADVRMLVFNPDGSEAEMCGNGARCVALYIRSARGAGGAGRGATRNPVTIETKAGVLSARVRGDQVAMGMTDPTKVELGLRLAVEGRRVQMGCVNTGVPHAVVPVKAIDEVDVSRIGRALRRHRRFAPRGTNVNFMQPDSRQANYLFVRTYERGVEGETLACGTGVVASAIMFVLSHPAASNGASSRRTIDVEARSGDRLRVSFTLASHGRRARVTDVVLEGAAARVFDGRVEWPVRRG